MPSEAGSPVMTDVTRPATSRVVCSARTGVVPKSLESVNTASPLRRAVMASPCCHENSVARERPLSASICAAVNVRRPSLVQLLRACPINLRVVPSFFSNARVSSTWSHAS